MDEEKITSAIVEAMHHTLVSPNVEDSNGEAANIVDAMDKVSRAIRWTAQLLCKGSENQDVPIGALEALGDSIETGAGDIAQAIRYLADVIQNRE